MSIEFDLPSSHCNIGGTHPNEDTPACVMCPRSSRKFRENPNFAVDNTNTIIAAVRPYMPYIRHLSILGVAEPFWKNKLFEVFDKLGFKLYRDRINFWTISNGSLFSENVAKKYIDYVPESTLIFSIDAGTKETYRKIRRLDFFETIRSNIQQYMKIKPAMHHVQIHNNINTLNAHEMTLMIEFAKTVGIHEVRFNPTHDCGLGDHVDDILIKQKHLPFVMAHYQQAQKAAHENQINLILVRDFEQAIP